MPGAEIEHLVLGWISVSMPPPARSWIEEVHVSTPRHSFRVVLASARRRAIGIVGQQLDDGLRKPTIARVTAARYGCTAIERCRAPRWRRRVLLWRIQVSRAVAALS